MIVLSLVSAFVALAQVAVGAPDPDAAWGAWRDGRIAEAESLATVLPPADDRSHLLAIAAFARGDYQRALAHYDSLGETYQRRGELDRMVVDAYLHLGRPGAARDFARQRGLEDVLIGSLEQRAAQPLAVSLDTLTTVPFAQHPLTPYLPAFDAIVEGRPTIVHLDTGGAFLAMGPSRAAALGIETIDAGTGFHATRQVALRRGIAREFRLGAAVLRNVPVAVLASLEGRQDLVIFGTNVLEQFLATIDYPNHRLILSPRADTTWRAQHLGMLPTRRTAVPFFLWGDHYLFARGGFGARRDLTYFIDSGLVSLAPGPNGLRQACFITTPEQYREWGVDSIATTQRHFESPLPVSLGPLEQRDQFFATVADPTWTSFGGVRIDGLLSHAFLNRYAWTLDFTTREFVFGEP